MGLNPLLEQRECDDDSSRDFAQAINGGCAVPLVRPVSAQISRQERPCARRAAILRASVIFRGCPRCFPFARAFRNPALTRLAIKLRSSSATAPRTVKTILPLGVDVSTPSEAYKLDSERLERFLRTQ